MPIRDRGRDRPKKQEREVAKDLGGKRVPYSGSLRHMPGDAESEQFLVDAKTTTESYSLTTKTLHKATAEARRRGKLPMLQVEFTNSPVSKKWAVIEHETFLDLLERAGYTQTDE